MSNLNRRQFQNALRRMSSDSPQYEDPGCALGNCADASLAFADTVARGRLVNVGGAGPRIRRGTGPGVNELSSKPDALDHVVWEGEVEGSPTVVDFTYRQFDPQARHPKVAPAEKYYQHWDRREDYEY